MTIEGERERVDRLEEAIRRKRAAGRARQARLPARPADAVSSLGEMQRSLWLLHRLEPSSPAYNLTSAFRVPGPLDLEALGRSFAALVARHRILRTTFHATGDDVRLDVGEQVAVGIERFAVEQGEARSTAAREARRPFDLAVGPLLRLLFVAEPQGGERLVVLVVHHILADERSLELIWQELADGYEGRFPASPPAAQYDDYVYWLQGRDTGKRAEDLAFWRERLEPSPEELVLPFERSGSEARGARGRLLVGSVDPAAADGIRRLAAATGTTPFVILAFAFRLLLHRYTSGADSAFATPVSTRSHSDSARMLGYFLNPVVLRDQVDEKRRVREAIRWFDGRMRESLGHAAIPFDALVEELAPRRAPGRHPFFQAMFVYREESPRPALGGVRLEPMTLDLGVSKFDLTLFASAAGGAIETAVEFPVDRFDDFWMRNLLVHYATILEHLGEDLEGTVAEVTMLPREERIRLFDLAAGPPLTAAGSAPLPRQILEQATRSPHAPALLHEDRVWTYAELERSGRRVAAELQRLGIQAGDRVGLFLDRSPLLIAGILGSHWAGAAYVPLDPAYPAARNLEALEDAEVSAVLTRTALRRQVPAGSARVVAVDALTGGDDVSRDLDLPPLEREQPAYVLFTSGSSGRPKGVIVTHGNLTASTEARRQVYDAPPRRFLLLPSVAFDSSVAGIFWTLAEGGTLVIPSDDEVGDPRRLAALVVDRQVTMLLAVPSLYAFVLDAGGDLLRGLEAVIVAGESCPRRLVETHFLTLPTTRLFNEYGPTEATVWATVEELERKDASRTVPIGRPIPGVRVDVLDELGRLVPAGVPGEGWISGPTVAPGYWRRPALTGESFVRLPIEGGREERRYRSGDRLAWTADGRLLFLGRLDEQLKIRGFRIEPGEIRAALLELEGVEETAVVARGAGELAAFVAPAVSIGDWRTRLADRLPVHMIPTRLVPLATLPRLPNGKLDTTKLREMDLEEAPAEEPLPSAGGRERYLVSLWEGLLGRSGFGLGENFFELGGHSLLVVEMTSAIERDLGVELAPADIFQHPTIPGVVDLLDRAGGSDQPTFDHLFPISPGGRETPLVFCVPHFFSATVASRFRGERPVYGLRGVSLRPEGNRGRWRSMRELGEELVREVRQRFPDRRLIVAGYSFGATMAVETVRLLEEQRVPVEGLVLIAPMPVDFYRVGPLRFQVDALRQPVAELSLGQAVRSVAAASHPLTLRPYERAWRLVAIQPWRRLLCLVGRLRLRCGLPLTPAILHADVRLERFRLHAGYRPGLVTAPTVILNPREPATDAAATWRPFFAGRFTVRDISDPHLGADSIEAAKAALLDELERLETA